MLFQQPKHKRNRRITKKKIMELSPLIMERSMTSIRWVMKTVHQIHAHCIVHLESSSSAATPRSKEPGLFFSLVSLLKGRAYKISTNGGASSLRPARDRYMYNFSTASTSSSSSLSPITSTTKRGSLHATSLQPLMESLQEDIHKNLML